MANQAAKKAAQAQAKTTSVYLPLIIAINVIYVLWRGVYHYDSFGKWHKAGLVFTSFMYYLSYRGVVGAVAMGIGNGGYYFDLLVLTAVNQIVCLFTDKGWYIYLMVPAYVLYGFLQRAIAKSKEPSAQDLKTPEELAQEAKRAAKKEKKEKRKGIRYMR
eukprot:TRINITY_DN25085_c0_g1_i1.p1 TRINITY_DN25085_c0_g1~~TRINITY_DN25085_c0_g1_i1.p1  ORF type:complete len:181 (-),score=54.06 TRINITY_DN25085_c0_g1_i1:27-506(-)